MMDVFRFLANRHPAVLKFGWRLGMWGLGFSFWGRFLAENPANQEGFWPAVAKRWPLKGGDRNMPKGPIRLHLWHTRGALDGIIMGLWAQRTGRPWRIWTHPLVYRTLGAPDWAFSAPIDAESWKAHYSWAQSVQGILIIFHAQPPRPRAVEQGPWHALAGQIALRDARGVEIGTFSAWKSLRWLAKHPAGLPIVLEWKVLGQDGSYQV
jgi:hypothetical protein